MAQAASAPHITRPMAGYASLANPSALPRWSSNATLTLIAFPASAAVSV